MLTKEYILETLRNEFNLEEYNIKSLALFGSFARDEQTEKSDIDLMYVFESRTNITKYFFKLIDDLEEIFGREIDLVSEKFMNPIKLSALKVDMIYV